MSYANSAICLTKCDNICTRKRPCNTQLCCTSHNSTSTNDIRAFWNLSQPAWFLRLGAPVFSEQLAKLFNLSLSSSVVPRQWKSAVIRPVPKVATAKSKTDFRPISITPVLTRIMEKSIVRQFLYPAFNQPSTASLLNDQFAFRPTGSTTAAIVFLLHTVTQMLNTNSHVIVNCHRLL